MNVRIIIIYSKSSASCLHRQIDAVASSLKRPLWRSQTTRFLLAIAPDCIRRDFNRVVWEVQSCRVRPTLGNREESEPVVWNNRRRAIFIAKDERFLFQETKISRVRTSATKDFCRKRRKWEIKHVWYFQQWTRIFYLLRQKSLVCGDWRFFLKQGKHYRYDIHFYHTNFLEAILKIKKM